MHTCDIHTTSGGVLSSSLNFYCVDFPTPSAARCPAWGEANARATAPCSANCLIAVSASSVLITFLFELSNNEAEDALAKAPCDEDCAEVQN